MPTHFVVMISLLAVIAPFKHIDLAAIPSPDLAIRSSYVKGCVKAFDDHTPKPLDLCYPCPVKIRIVAYNQGTRNTKASLVIEVTNSSKSAITLPVAVKRRSAASELTQSSFSVGLESAGGSIGDGFAYSDTGDPGDSIEYEIPVDVEQLKQIAQRSAGTPIAVFAKLGSSKLKKQGNGDWVSVTDTNPIPSNTFRIPYPN